jgi:S-adenosylmethionine:tRNA ribosyltransferase-isomerase
MRVSEFDFDLPDHLIALRPACPRDAARMLVVHANGALEDSYVRDLPDFLDIGDALVLNDTRVIRARLVGHRAARAGAVSPKIEVLLHRRLAPDRFLAFARPARRLAPGDNLALGRSLAATVIARGEGSEVELGFTSSGPALDRAIAAEGEVPLPPYIAGKRRVDARDAADYQTVFAEHEGSVAAPTAGLHFTPELLTRLAAKGIARELVTLHVGAGTFLPVSAVDIEAHAIHPESAHLDGAAAVRLNRVCAEGGRIAAVGTTSLRTLETAAGADGTLRAFDGETGLFITPGYHFKSVDILLTNFHLPRSTLFMLVTTFSGLETMRRAYAHAIAHGYRFYSYGDACLLFRHGA